MVHFDLNCMYVCKEKKGGEEEKKKKRDDYHCHCIEKSKSTRKLQVTQCV